MTIFKVINWAVAPICIGIIAACATSNQQPQAHSLVAPISYARGENGYRWVNVAIGGGGFVTGVYSHPLEKDLVYIRTDVGGFYRWNAINKSWIPLTDSFPFAQWNYYGGEALAIDPKNPNIVYIAAGKYTKDWAGKGTIFKSSDRGKNWTKLNIDLPMGANEDHRWAGERLAVNPSNSQEIFFGSRTDGLWKSSDAGATWAKVTSFSPNLTAGIGILGILFDARSPGSIYVNVYGDGIYKSTDTGATWSKIAGSPNQPQRMAVTGNGILYVTHMSGVSKYEKGDWSNITPDRNQTAFNALAVNPTNPKEVVVALAQSPFTKIYRTLDGGVTWTEKKSSVNHTVPWRHPKYKFELWTSAIEFDPKVPSKIWLTGGYGVWQTNNMNSDRVVWTNYDKGIEELVTFSLIAPPKGSVLLSGVADTDGFYHNNGLNAYPSKTFGSTGPDFDNTYSLAYSESDALRLVRVGGTPWKSTSSGATSTDGGLTWRAFPSFPANTMLLRVAVSATNPNQFVVVLSKAPPVLTTDGGTSWNTVSGLPNGPEGPWYWNQPLAADSVDGKRFYYYSDGKIYGSTDGGASFSLLNSSLPNSNSYGLKTVRGVKGEVWLSLDWNGLLRSTDGGKTFAKISSVERAHLFAFGKPPTGKTTPALYLYGKIAGMGEGIFRSLDRGQTWTNIGSSQNPIGNQPNVMEASWQQFGLVFIGTNGRGVFYGTPDNTKAVATSSLRARATLPGKEKGSQ